MVRYVKQMHNKEQMEVPMTEKETKCCCCNRKKERSEQEYKDLINRLSRIEGQIRGIKRMLDEDCYCPDIITQVAAANAALNSFNKVLLANHIKTCVADDIRAVFEQYRSQERDRKEQPPPPRWHRLPV